MNYTKKKLVNYDEDKYQRVRWLQDMFRRYENYYQSEIYRMISNQRMYWGVNFGQWPAYAVEKLILQGRRPPQFNFIAKKIESTIGSFLSNGFDMKYKSKTGKNTHWQVSLLDMMYSDKSNCDWESSEIVALRDMHCMVGYERMFISDRNDQDFGNIAWEALPPTHIFIDPEWKSVNAWDIDNYFEYGDFSVSKIARMFPKKKAHLRELMEREQRDGVDYGDFNGGVSRYTTTEQKWGSYHRVIIFHYITEEVREWEYDLINRIPFPDNGYDQGSKEDEGIKAEYIQRMGLQPGEWTKIRQKRRVKRIEAICPTIDNEMFLMGGKDKIQTNNCNIYPVGNQFYGQFRGFVDDATDVQLQYNKGKMMTEDIIQRSAKGAMILDDALHGGDYRKKQQIEEQWNNPAARIWVDEGATADLGQHGGIIELPHGQVTPDMFRTNNENLDLFDRLSTMPAAMDSRTEASGESGKLLQTKIQVGLLSQKYGMKIYERHKREKALAYPLQAKITYSGYPREFRRQQGEPLILNQAGVDSFNRRVVINDISTMPEMDVVLVPSPSGHDLRTELRSQYAEVLPLLEKDPKDRLLRLIFIKNIFKSQDMSEDEKAEIEKGCTVLITIEAMNNAMLYAQAKQQMAQLMQPQIPEGEANPEAKVGGFDQNKAIQGTPQEAEYTPVEKGAP